MVVIMQPTMNMCAACCESVSGYLFRRTLIGRIHGSCGGVQKTSCLFCVPERVQKFNALRRLSFYSIRYGNCLMTMRPYVRNLGVRADKKKNTALHPEFSNGHKAELIPRIGYDADRC
jgi:hypothetical protein